MEIDELLSKAKGLPEWQQRRVAAILGSLVADAAGTVWLMAEPRGLWFLRR